jgi:hypothetical protein
LPSRPFLCSGSTFRRLREWVRRCNRGLELEEEISLNHGRKTVRGTLAQKSLAVYDTGCVTSSTTIGCLNPRCASGVGDRRQPKDKPGDRRVPEHGQGSGG